MSSMRAQARQQRRAYPDPQGAAQAVSKAITSLGWLDGANAVAASMCDDGELDPAPLVRACRLKGICVYMPVLCDPDPLKFAPTDEDTIFELNRYGIAEPVVDSSLWVSAKGLDIVFTPVVLFDAVGRRAGRGEGNYDRALSFLLNGPRPAKPLVIGLAYERQLTDGVASHPGDVAMDAVVTEEQVRVFTKALSRPRRA
ncbi:MAG: 5-formyltetrahydrofolate cyclo-ligase [bacterium]|nr:5-formyltetrahydrofolate cyclo-ligase [bacterium]